MLISVVIGNPNRGGRTTRVGEAVAAAIAPALSPAGADPARIETVELADVAVRLFEWQAPELDELTAAVAGSSVVVAACPTYKASYTGLLKAFFDRYQTNALAGTVAVPVMVGAAPNHALAVEVHLRALLVELGAAVPSRGLYVLESEVDSLDDVVGDWAAAAVPLIGATATAR